MSSKTKETIEIQKSFCEAALLRRQTELKNKGLEDARITKDTRVRHLRAKMRQANRRLLSTSKIQKQIEGSALRKRQRASEKPEELKPSKKSTPQLSIQKKKDEKPAPTAED